MSKDTLKMQIIHHKNLMYDAINIVEKEHKLLEYLEEEYKKACKEEERVMRNYEM